MNSRLVFFILTFFFAACSFQTSFLRQINMEYKNKNVVISPLSAYQVLGLTSNGAKGRTLQEMLSTLQNASLEELNQINTAIIKTIKKFTSLEIANAVMTKVSPTRSFINAAHMYEATVETLRDVAQVNNWCNLKTHGKIKKIIEELDKDAIMVLLNAIYFKGTWYKEFNRDLTTKKTFYNFGDKKRGVKVDTMSITEKFNYYEDKSVQIIELPYTKDSMSAYIILPDETKDINRYIEELTDEKLNILLKRMSTQTLVLELPKFELEFSAELNKCLQKLGMLLAFGENADFSALIPGGGAYISKVIQKSYLKVDEQGTEAASSTAVIIRKNGPVLSMLVDRPFLFLLKNGQLPADHNMIMMAKVSELK